MFKRFITSPLTVLLGYCLLIPIGVGKLLTLLAPLLKGEGSWLDYWFVGFVSITATALGLTLLFGIYKEFKRIIYNK